jgi:hypothetical protein
MGLLAVVIMSVPAADPATGTPTKAVESCISGNEANRFQAAGAGRLERR